MGEHYTTRLDITPHSKYKIIFKKPKAIFELMERFTIVTVKNEWLSKGTPEDEGDYTFNRFYVLEKV